MKKYFIALFLMLLGVIWLIQPAKPAKSAPIGPQLIITQIKITSGNGQFITLYNNTNAAIDLSTIQLQYFNNFDLLKATSGKLISLSGKVPAHGFAVVDDGPIQACYQMTVNSVSLGLSSTAGFVQVSHFLGTTSPQVVSILDDYVGWSKAATAGAQTLPSSTSAFLQRKAPDNSQNYANISIPGSGSWVSVGQPDGSAPCDTAVAGTAGGGTTLGTGSVPIPFTVISSSATLSSIPADDNGLSAPQISEVLPNPAPPKTDADDEFVELYNSNGKPFDLSGFILQVGTTTIHKYTFPDGTTIEPNKFSAFYSSDTGLSLSNSDGQVKLLDPAGNLLNQTDEYSNAKDGYAWVSADGLWQWTTSPTPNAANIIATPPASKSSKPSSGANGKSAVKGAKTAAAGSSGSAAGPSAISSTGKMHPLVLAGVGAAALIYALYEYRHDLANHLYKLRRNRAVGQPTGQ
jgi:hypothetical protein